MKFWLSYVDKIKKRSCKRYDGICWRINKVVVFPYKCNILLIKYILNDPNVFMFPVTVCINTGSILLPKNLVVLFSRSRSLNLTFATSPACAFYTILQLYFFQRGISTLPVLLWSILFSCSWHFFFFTAETFGKWVRRQLHWQLAGVQAVKKQRVFCSSFGRRGIVPCFNTISYEQQKMKRNFSLITLSCSRGNTFINANLCTVMKVTSSLSVLVCLYW